MIISEITLEEMLYARERRAAMQGAMLERHGLPLLSFTLNIPGPVKRTPLTELAFNAGLKGLAERLDPVESQVIREATGSEAIFAVSMEAGALKAVALELEGEGIGRLYDMDVVTEGGKLSRPEPRACIVCGGHGAACSRSRAHGLDAVLGKMDGMLRAFAAQTLGGIAREALIAEVLTAPKPGLVDTISSGAHRDMGLDTFVKSAGALLPYFREAVSIGLDTAAEPPAGAMEVLRPRGVLAEEEMLSATGGVNTHKGMVYSLGLLLCGAGRALVTGAGCVAEAGSIARSDALERLARAKAAPATHGDVAYAKAGAAGARGEAAAGFPGALAAAEAIRGYLARGLSPNDAYALTLCGVMAKTADTNLLHRGGAEGLRYAQAQARRINAMPEGERIGELRRLDGEFIARNLSPGGCADILALGIFLNSAGELIEI